jgi:hypothetical protein
VTVDFYLYFPDEARAGPAIDRLKRKGFKVESRLSAEETEWLVLAAKSINPLFLFLVERMMEKLAFANGGEYDGYERAV